MARYIDADKLKQRKRHIDFIMSSGKLYDGYDFVKFSDIDETPTADVQEVKHGEWIIEQLKNGKNVCYRCPNCGTKMDGKER